MLRTRVVAVLLAVAILCCSLVFSVSAANEPCDISVSLVGSGTVSINGTEHDVDFTNAFDPGESVTLAAVPDEDFEFLFWVNRETSKIVSQNATYTFTVATYALYEAVFDITESVAAEDGYHTVIYLTQGENIIYMQPVGFDDTSYFDEVGTTGMFISGKTWIGWDHTPEDVAVTEGRIFVRPLYNTDASFTVTWTVNGETQTQVEQYLSMLTLVAPAEQNGQKFSYWIARARDVNSVDEIASFYSTYQFYVTGDVTLEAIYGASYDVGISTRISGDLPSFNESAISIFAEHSLTRDYTVIQHGILVTMDMQIGSFPDTFVINPDEPKIVKSTATDTTRVGSWRANIRDWNAVNAGSYSYYPRIFARAYMIAMDKSGVMHTVYSAIYCTEYVLGTGEGGGDNHDDPFG